VNEGSVAQEETLVREAASRIRKWLRERRPGDKSQPSPRLAIKFCGGCNPDFDRGSVAQRIREEVSREAVWVSGEEESEFLLIINGCRTACADTAEIRAGRPAVVVSAETVDD